MMFRVITPKVNPGQTVKVVGSCAELGDWNPRLGVTMSADRAIPLYTATVPYSLPDSLEYKFIICEGDNVIWEEGANRTLHNPGPLDFRGRERWKATGVAIPVFSLRSDNDFGVGDFEDLKLMADWAASRGMNVIQILPVNDTTMTRTRTDSYPYNANSTIALHPLYLRPELLGHIKDEATRRNFELLREELQQLPEVDYERVFAAKEAYARAIFEQEGVKTLTNPEFYRFLDDNSAWLIPYAAFSALRDKYGTPDFRQWGDDSRYSTSRIVNMLNEDGMRHIMQFYFFVQFHLHNQLRDAAAYCRSKGVALKGDIPIGISPDSVDAWQNPELFNLDMQAGAPPDDFAREGQNWGFPTYNWNRMAPDGYAWWARRLKKMGEYFDAFRIDHVLGFFRIWEIPSTEVYGLLGHFSPALPLTPEEMENQFGFSFKPEMARPLHSTEGYANQREALAAGRADLLPRFADRLFVEDSYQPGKYHPRIAGYDTEMFRTLPEDQRNAYGRLHEEFFYRRHDDLWRKNAERRLPAVVNATSMLACAEDLGMIPACVPSVLNKLQVLSLEVQRMPKEFGVSLGRPETYSYQSVATTSTHDMPPLRLWLMQVSSPMTDPTPEQCAEYINAHVHSPAMLTILPLQDWLSADAKLRRPDPTEEQINIPSNPRHYWRYRMHLTLENLLANI